MPGLFVLFLLIIKMFAISTINADTITLQNGLNGYSGCKDTYIDKENPSATNGDISTIRVEYCSSWQGPDARLAIKFDISSISNPYQIKNAILSLYQVSGTTSSSYAEVNPILGSWETSSLNWNNKPMCDYVIKIFKIEFTLKS